MTYYDAEIEYLESTSTQWIDTEIIPDATTGFEIKVVCSNNYETYFIGLRNDSGNTRWGAGHSSYGFYWCYGTFGARDRLNSRSATIKLNYLKDKRFVATNDSDTVDVLLPTLSFTPAYNIRLFGSAGVDASYSKWSGKIYYCQITQGSELIMDLIPVRIGSVGYMYDKVSDRLFGNAGTGSFVLGPDVAGWPGVTGKPKVSSIRRQMIQLMPKYKWDLEWHYTDGMPEFISINSANGATQQILEDCLRITPATGPSNNVYRNMLTFNTSLLSSTQSYMIEMDMKELAVRLGSSYQSSLTVAPNKGSEILDIRRTSTKIPGTSYWKTLLDNNTGNASADAVPITDDLRYKLYIIYNASTHLFTLRVGSSSISRTLTEGLYPRYMYTKYCGTQYGGGYVDIYSIKIKLL